MDDESIRSVLNDAARAAPTNPDRSRQVVARARRSARVTMAAAVGATAVATLAVVVWARQPSPVTPADSRAPVYVGVESVTYRKGTLDVRFTGGDPALAPGDLCYESYTASAEPGAKPDEIVVWIKVNRPSPPPNPTPSLHRVCDDLGYARHILIPVDREYAVVIDGRMLIRYPVVRESAVQPT